MSSELFRVSTPNSVLFSKQLYFKLTILFYVIILYVYNIYFLSYYVYKFSIFCGGKTTWRLQSVARKLVKCFCQILQSTAQQNVKEYCRYRHLCELLLHQISSILCIFYLHIITVNIKFVIIAKKVIKTQQMTLGQN